MQPLQPFVRFRQTFDIRHRTALMPQDQPFHPADGLFQFTALFKLHTQFQHRGR